jgi:hypothetical protein
MKNVGFMVAGPNEADRYLDASLKELERLTDDAVIVGNNTDPKTEALIRSYGFWFYRDDREWGKCQPLIKTDLLRKVAQLNPTHVTPLDADEVFGKNVTRATLESLKDNLGSYFHIQNLWNDEDHYSQSLSFWNVRFYQFDPTRIGFTNKPVHCGLAPPYAYHQGIYVPYIVKHYGLMKKEDRRRKVERYNKYDPDAKYKDRSFYDALASDWEGSRFNEDDIQRKVEAEVAKYGDQKKTKTPETMSKYFYVKRLKDGAVLDVPERDLQRTLATKRFELIGEAVIQAAAEAPVVVSESSLKCIICGKEAKNKLGLLAHKRSHK